MTDKDVRAILRKVADEWDMPSLSEGVYGDFVLEVVQRVIPNLMKEMSRAGECFNVAHERMKRFAPPHTTTGILSHGGGVRVGD